MTALRQPKALYLLFAVKMWECFSFYGMRALMVLYLIHELGMSDGYSFGVYAIYGALFEFGGILGGLIADRLLGLRRAIIWGGWLIAAGHICLSLQTAPWAFFSGLGLIVVGSALFSSNISALLGLFYEEDDPRREGGYTLYYIGFNIGALLATLLCGIVAELWGWHYGFGLAAIGMIAGNLLFIGLQGILEGKGNLERENPSYMGYGLLVLAFPLCTLMMIWESVFLPLMPVMCIAFLLYMGRKMWFSGKFSKETLALLGLYLGALSLFYAAEDLTASALLVFSERFAEESIFPVTSLLSLNPFVIIVGGVILSRWISGQTHHLVAAGLMLSTLAFCCLALVCSFSAEQVPLAVPAIAITVISMGEVLLGPAIFAFCSQIAPKGWSGATMGLIPVGFSLGNTLSGFLSKSMSDAGSISDYGVGFLQISLLLGGMTVIVLMVGKRRLIHEYTI